MIKNVYRIKTVAVVLALVVASILSGYSCNSASGDGIVVAVTIPPLGDFVRQVGGNKVQVMVMVPPGADPHIYEPTPSQMVQLSKARMYAKVGSGVEFELTWMENLIAQNRNMLVVDCSVGIQLLDGEDEHDDNGDDHHHHGADPHIWLSPVNAKQMVNHICAGLIEVDPDNADFYRANRDDYLAQLDDLDADIREILDGPANRHFMIYHPAFGYFAHEYDLVQVPIEHGGKEPTPAVLASVISHANEYNLQYVFVAPQFVTSHAETIASQIGGSLLYVDPLPIQYIDSMLSVAEEIAKEIE